MDSEQTKQKTKREEKQKNKKHLTLWAYRCLPENDRTLSSVSMLKYEKNIGGLCCSPYFVGVVCILLVTEHWKRNNSNTTHTNLPQYRLDLSSRFLYMFCFSRFEMSALVTAVDDRQRQGKLFWSFKKNQKKNQGKLALFYVCKYKLFSIQCFPRFI